MNLKEIEALLEKFYNGETSLEEERSLREYFNSDIVPEHFSAYQEQFRYYQSDKDEKSPAKTLEHKLADKIREEGNGNHAGRRRRLYYTITGIAASILIFIGIYFQFIVNDNNRNSYTMENTYEDPEQAYAEAKKALLLVSEKFNAGVQDFNKFSTFNQYKELITRKN